MIKEFYQEVWIGPGQWRMEFSWMNLFGAVLLLGMGPGFALYMTVKLIWEHQQQLHRVLPFRFHRQRREVMLSRWDKRAKKLKCEFFRGKRCAPWLGKVQRYPPVA